MSGGTFFFICWLGSHNLFHSCLVSTSAFPNEPRAVSCPALSGPGKISCWGHSQGDDLVPSPAIYNRTQLQLAIKDIPFSLLPPSPSPQNTLFLQSMWRSSTGSKQEGGGRSHRFVPSKNIFGIFFFCLFTICIPCLTNFYGYICCCPSLHVPCVWQREMG